MSEPYTIGKLTRKRSDGSSYWAYCIKWYEGGTRKRFSLDTTDKVAAEALARAYWNKRTLGPAHTVGAVMLAYLASLNGTKDERRKRDGWKAAELYWSALAVTQIDEGVSLGYTDWRGRSINTVRNELSAIRTALKWAVGRKIIAEAPKIIVPEMPPSSVDHLTKPQFTQFLTGCVSPHVQLFAMLAVSTGGRKAALLEAKWEQVSWAMCQMDLNPVGRVQNSKGRAIVPLGERIMCKLREAHEARLSDYIIEVAGARIKDIKKGVAASAVRSGIHAHPHMFRHSAAVWMAEDRVPMAEIAAFLGHKDINITIRVYARYHPDYLRNAARSLTW